MKNGTMLIVNSDGISVRIETRTGGERHAIHYALERGMYQKTKDNPHGDGWGIQVGENINGEAAEKMCGKIAGAVLEYISNTPIPAPESPVVTSGEMGRVTG